MNHRPGDGGGGADSDSIEEPFETLQDPDRRALCRYLLRSDADLVTHEELLEYLLEGSSTAETTGTAETPGGDRRRDRNRGRSRRITAAQLRHAHLPALDDAGLLEYDPETGVAYVDRGAIVDYLERAQAAIADLLAEREGRNAE